MRRLFLTLVFIMFVWGLPHGALCDDSDSSLPLGNDLKEAPADITQIDKNLKAIESDLTVHSLSQNKMQQHIKELNDYHAVLTSSKIKDTEELNGISKKIAALTSLTAEGETEPAEITKQRQEFIRQSDEIKARIASTDLALEQINEINSSIIKIRNQQLLEQITVKRESVLNIQNFWKSVVSFASFLYEVCASPYTWYRQFSPEQRQSMIQRLVFLAFIVLICVFLSGFASRWIRKKWGYRDNIKPNYMEKVYAAFVTLFARGIMPSVLAGALWFWLYIHRSIFSGAFGLTLRVGLLYLLYLILSSTVVLVLFAPQHTKWRLIEVKDDKAKSLSFALIFSVTMICVFSYFQVLAIRLEYSDDIVFSLKLLANGVKAFCIVLIANRALYNNRALTEEELKKSLENDLDSDIQALSLSSKISLLISGAALIVFAFSLLGYILFSEYVFNRFIASVVIVGLFYIIQKALLMLFRQFASLKIWLKDFHITKKQTDKAIFWFGLIITPILYMLCAIVLLAVWGISVDILLHNVKKFLMGFDIGGMHVSIVSIFLGIVFFFLSLFVVKMVKNSLLNGKLSKIDMDIGVRNSLAAGIGFVGIVISCLIGITVMGGSLKGLAIMAGALSIGAGLGLQNIVNNFVSGFILLFERPIKIGDWVIINDYEGTVKQINIRSTVLETFNKADVIIPNASILSNNLVNMTYKNKTARIDIAVGVGYESDIDLVKSVLLDIAAHTKNILSSPAPFVAFLELADSSLNFRLSCYTQDVFNKTNISNAIRENIVKRFREENINIPFPQRVVYLHTEDRPVEVRVSHKGEKLTEKTTDKKNGQV